MFWTRSNLATLTHRLSEVPLDDALAREFECSGEDLILGATRIVLGTCRYDIAHLKSVADRLGVPPTVYDLAAYELFALNLKPAALLRRLAPNAGAILELRDRMASSFKNKGIATELMTDPGFTYQLYREARMILAEVDYLVNWIDTPLADNLEHLMRAWRLEYKFKHVLAYRLSKNGRASRAELLKAYGISMPRMTPPVCRGEAHRAYAARHAKRPAEADDEPRKATATEPTADSILIGILLETIDLQRRQLESQSEMLSLFATDPAATVE